MDVVRGRDRMPMEDPMRIQCLTPNQHQLRDQAIAAALRDQLTNDRRTMHLRLSVLVGGGVAHIEGAVGSEEERQLVRRLLRNPAGLFAVWDLVTVSDQPLKVMDVGCGGKKQIPWAIGIDRVELPGVDVVADIEGPLPFDADTFDHVFAVHVLEHIHDLLGLMRELHRVVRPTGVLHVIGPYWRHVHAVADPTHVRFLDGRTFRYFCESRPGQPQWRPLMITSTDDTVFADLQPVTGAAAVDPTEIARWFS